jgi:hypothetical protein
VNKEVTLMTDVNAAIKNLTAIAIPAARTFVLTFAAMLLLGFILVAPAFYIASPVSVWWGALGGFLALAATGALGWMMASKKAIAAGLKAAIDKYQAGSNMVRMIFAKIPGIETAQSAASLLPLGEAESLFKKAVQDTVSAPQEGGGIQGFIRRKVQDNLCEKISSLTLTQFRAEQGGVDLIKVRDLIAAKADVAIQEKIESVRSSANLFILFAILASVGLAFAVRILSAKV